MARGTSGLCLMGTGEGGLWPQHLVGGPDAQIEFQIGTGYFGCRGADGAFSMSALRNVVHDNPSVAAIQIKLSQGAKQDGGKAPGWKVDEEVAKRRGIEPWKDCFSPPTHSAFSGACGLADFVHRVRENTRRVVGIKLAIGSFLEFDQMCESWTLLNATVPDYLQIDGGEGGTGAAYEEMMKCGGMPASVAIQVADLLLRKHGLREHIVLVGSAGGHTPEDLVRMYALGADIVATGRAFKYATGCVAAGKCHIAGECPTGVASNGEVIDPVERGKWIRAYVEAMYERTAHLLSIAGIDDYREIVGTRRKHVEIVGVPIWTIDQVESIIALERG